MRTAIYMISLTAIGVAETAIAFEMSSLVTVFYGLVGSMCILMDAYEFYKKHK